MCVYKSVNPAPSSSRVPSPAPVSASLLLSLVLVPHLELPHTDENLTGGEPGAIARVYVESVPPLTPAARVWFHLSRWNSPYLHLVHFFAPWYASISVGVRCATHLNRVPVCRLE